MALPLSISASDFFEPLIEVSPNITFLSVSIWFSDGWLLHDALKPFVAAVYRLPLTFLRISCEVPPDFGETLHSRVSTHSIRLFSSAFPSLQGAMLELKWEDPEGDSEDLLESMYWRRAMAGETTPNSAGPFVRITAEEGEALSAYHEWEWSEE